MRGDLVIVRSYKGIPLVRRVWESDDLGVYITDDVNYELLLAGTGRPPIVGFPIEDVFAYDSGIAEKINDSYIGGGFDWSKLAPYN